jgi:NAD(P)-dependent dehydrogenase (short-subunit alcohol dehydrogenase family)
MEVHGAELHQVGGRAAVIGTTRASRVPPRRYSARMQFRGKVALVTGAGSGIGRASALAFAREGATVVVSDTVEATGVETVRLIEKTSGQARFIATDVARADEVQRLIGTIVEEFGRLDYAHNNAGIVRGGLTHEMSEDDWARVLEVNLTGVWRCMKHEIAHMLRQGGGAVVNTASVLGLVGNLERSAYAASKHGVVGLTRVAALEYAQRGVRVNAVCPGVIQTGMTAARLDDPGQRARMLADEPIGRYGEPAEVAEMVVWLCSDAASFVTETDAWKAANACRSSLRRLCRGRRRVARRSHGACAFSGLRGEGSWRLRSNAVRHAGYAVTAKLYVPAGRRTARARDKPLVDDPFVDTRVHWRPQRLGSMCTNAPGACSRFLRKRVKPIHQALQAEWLKMFRYTSLRSAQQAVSGALGGLVHPMVRPRGAEAGPGPGTR